MRSCRVPLLRVLLAATVLLVLALPSPLVELSAPTNASHPEHGAGTALSGPASPSSGASSSQVSASSASQLPSLASCGTTPTALAACGEARASLATGPTPLGTPSWNTSCSPCSPIAREGVAMVYDAADGYVLLYGGLQDVTNTEPGDTWTYKGGTWTQLAPAVSPSPRLGSGMAYDAADGYVVLFGGADEKSNQFYADTWEFLAGTWTQLSPNTSPTGRYFPSMTYDAADGYVVLFGGATSTLVPLGDTWTFSGGQWTLLLPSTSPSSRYTAGMAYDQADGYVLLYGGLSGSTYLGDTWEFLAGTWTQLSPAVNPGKLANIAEMMSWDSAISAVLLVGGDSGTASCTANTWTYKGGTWTLQSPSPSLPVRAQGGLADDPADSTALEFSGWNCGTPISDYTDAYTYFGGFATLSAKLVATPTATDVNSAIQFQGTASGGFPPYTTTIRFGDGGSAASLSPSHTYTTAGNYTVWMWVNDSSAGRITATTTVTVNALPTVHGSALPNPVDQNVPAQFSPKVVGGTAPFHYGWRFGDGSNSSQASPSHAYAATGTYTVVLWANDTPGNSATGSFTLVVHPSPSVTATANPSVTDALAPVAFSASPSSGTPPYQVNWNFGDGHTGTGTSLSHAYAAAGNYTAMLWANDSGGGSATSQLAITVHKGLSTPVLALLPDPADVGTAVSFSASYWGGTPAYTYGWQFGDGATSSLPSPSHVFHASGNFTVALWVNDSVGGTARATSLLRVDPALVLVSFTGAFAPNGTGLLDLGQWFNATVLTRGGSAPLTYVYRGLPNGCASQDQARLSCKPTATGNDTVEVQVSDLAGASLFANLSLKVSTPLSLMGVYATTSPVSSGVSDPIQVELYGGSTPYTFTYLSLPTGCTSSDQVPLPCVPTHPGNYRLAVEVTDAAGASAFSNSSLAVNSDPEITSFQVYPSNSTVGETVTFVVVIAGGTGSISYSYAGEPPGCTGLGRTGGACAPSAAGTYHVKITVVDADNRQANASVELQVAPQPNFFIQFIGNDWWVLVLAVIVGVALAVFYLDRRHRRRSGLADLRDGVALDAMSAVAPTPEGHPLVDDANPPLPEGVLRDQVAPVPSPEAPDYDEDSYPEDEAPSPKDGETAWKPVPLHPTEAPGSPAGTSSPTPTPQGPTPAGEVGPGAPPQGEPVGPPTASGSLGNAGAPVAPGPSPSSGLTPTPIPIPTPQSYGSSDPLASCSICGAPLREGRFCDHCGVAWS